jgi:hypothetical protein
MEAPARRAPKLVDEVPSFDRDAFLSSARALPICAREFDRLATEVTRLVGALDASTFGAAGEVRRAPGRCMVQLGEVALSLSWVRARVDTAADGRLLLLEWQGQIGRGAEPAPEHSLDSRPAGTATLLRESVFAAEATNEHDWRWRREGSRAQPQSSKDLAAKCVSSLVSSWRKVR